MAKVFTPRVNAGKLETKKLRQLTSRPSARCARTGERGGGVAAVDDSVHNHWPPSS